MLLNDVGSIALLFASWAALPWVSASPLVSGASAANPVQDRTAHLQLENNLAWVHRWAAVGDSYAAGIGAGNSVDRQCSRFDQAYPSVIRSHELFPQDQEFQFLACSGAQSSQVAKQVLSLNANLDAITISTGGSDVDLVGLLNECVYAWSPKSSCQKAIANSKKIITSVLPRRLDQVYAAASQKLARGGMAYVTGYPRFFDETTRDCDKAAFNFWSKRPRDTWQHLTVERRKDMNELTDMVNTAIADAVKRAGSNFVFVSYDNTFGRLQGRYCLPGVSEPDPNRADLLFYQMGSRDDPEMLVNQKTAASDASKDSKDFSPDTFEGQIQQLIAAGDPNASDAQSGPAGTSDAQNSPDGTSNAKRALQLTLPDHWAHVFHPTQLGHSVIAGKVLYQMSVTGAQKQGNDTTGIEDTHIEAKVCPNTDTQEAPPTPTVDPNAPKAIPKDQRAGCGKELGWNFPRQFQLTDAKVPMTDLWVRMREQVCKGVCQGIPGVPDEVVAAAPQGEKGCEYAVKLSMSREAYFYSSGSGQNCYDATELMINQCMTLKKDAHSISEAAWVNGPNFGEFYQVGVRDLNALGSHHPQLSTDPSVHLPHLHVACTSEQPSSKSIPILGVVEYLNALPLAQEYELKIGGWDDGQDGKTIEKNLKRCLRTGIPKFQLSKSTEYQFKDGTTSTYEISWVLFNGQQHCAEDKLADALGLNGYQLHCSQKLTELDVYS